MSYVDPVGHKGAEPLLSRMFSPPAGKSSWSYGIVPFSQHQVRFPRNARPRPPLPAPAVLLGVLSPQAAWEYAKTGFRHGPLGLWRDELLVKQMVRAALLPPHPSSHARCCRRRGMPTTPSCSP